MQKREKLDDILMHRINPHMQRVYFYLFVSLATGRRGLFLLLYPLDLHTDFLLSTIKIPFPVIFPIKNR